MNITWAEQSTYLIQIILTNRREDIRSQHRKMRAEFYRGAPGDAPHRGYQVTAVDDGELRGIEALYQLVDEGPNLVVGEMQDQDGYGGQRSFRDHGAGRVVIDEGHHRLLKGRQFGLLQQRSETGDDLNENVDRIAAESFRGILLQHTLDNRSAPTRARLRGAG